MLYGVVGILLGVVVEFLVKIRFLVIVGILRLAWIHFLVAVQFLLVVDSILLVMFFRLFCSNMKSGSQPCYLHKFSKVKWG